MTFSKDHPMYGIKIADPFNVARIEVGYDFKQPKPLVIYHGNCADGFSAAWCFWNLSNKNFDFHAGVYNEAPPDVSGRVVYLVDFSYKREVVEEMLKTARHIYLIDHHKTAIDDLLNGPQAILADGIVKNFTAYTDLERSGAMLAWDFIHNTQWYVNEEALAKDIATEFKPGDAEYVAPPLLLGHVQDRDLWRFKLPWTREIQAAVFSYEYTFENWDDMMLGDMTYAYASIPAQMKALSDLKTQGEAIERKHHKDIAELVKVCQRFMTFRINGIDGNGYRVPTASLPYTLTSDAGHLMAKNYEEGRFFAACYWDTPDHRIFSLRSTENGMDVSAIAKAYGGGGHKHAAGFRVSRDHELARS